jgi:hypothetical protein
VAAVRQLVAGAYGSCASAKDLRREALDLMRTAREIEKELPTGGDSKDT